MRFRGGEWRASLSFITIVHTVTVIMQIFYFFLSRLFATDTSVPVNERGPSIVVADDVCGYSENFLNSGLLD